MARRGGTLGIDIGGTKVLMALYDRNFKIVEEAKFKTRVRKGQAAFEETLADAIKTMVRKSKREGLKLDCVGVGCAALVDSRSGTTLLARNIPFLTGYKLGKFIRRASGAPVHVVNDVRAGLYGEFRLGAAKGAKHVLGVFVGTGIGGALIINGKLYEGATGSSGDIGNYVLHVMSSRAAVPGERVLDNVASRSAIAADTAKLASSQASPARLQKIGTDATRIRSVHLAEAVKKGDKTVLELITNRAHIIGAALSNLVDFINPDMVVLGGGLVEALPSLMKKEIRKSLKEHTAKENFAKLKIEVTALKEYAVAAGAARLALDMKQRRRLK